MPESSGATTTPTIAILGAGVSGLCMGIALKRAGFDAFTIYEKSDRLGGTWYENSYPGAGCDVPSHLYCFSFEPNPDWSRKFSLQPEIQRYLHHCATKYGVLPHVRFGTEIAGARFDAAAGVWRIRTRAGEEIAATVLVSGTGQLNRPFVPAIPGLDDFQGVRFHSARWRHDQDLRGKRVAVIGNGASAVQFIPPVAAVAKRVNVFQRTANWVIPRNDRAYRGVEKALFRYVPMLLKLYRWLIYLQLEVRFFAFFKGSWLGGRIQQAATEYLHSLIADPALREKLTPDYPVGCKRILISDDYYQALARPNVDVVTSPITRVTRDGVVTADGVHHPADTLILATGFQATSFLAPMQIEGLGGKKLEEVWRGGAEAHLGLTVAGFPNFFMMYGPNTNLGHNSIIFMIECQVNYAVRCIQELSRKGLAYLDVKPEAMRTYNEGVQAELAKSAWAAGCKSWYKTASGKVTNNWSNFTVAYWWRTRRPDFSQFKAVSRA